MTEAIAHYTILEDGVPDGIGRFARARDTRVGRTVALRLWSRADPTAAQQFLHDARLAAKLSHPNIAAVYDVGEWNGAPYIACEFVTGEPLRVAIGGRPMHARRAADIAIQIADALAEAQAAGIVHADLSVDNVITTPRGHIKLVNVGITRWSDANGSDGSRPPDAGEDLRALGSVLVEMLTGRPPVKGEVLRTGAARDTPQELSTIVGRLQAARGPEASHLAAVIASELRACATTMGDEPEESDSRPFPAAAERRGTPLAWLLGAVALAAIGALLWLAMRSG